MVTKKIVPKGIVLPSPKRDTKHSSGFAGIYPYYASFPQTFVETILKQLALDSDAVIFDPWNGSGTTTASASKLGFESIGFDVNPVMVVVAKARLLAASEASSLIPLAHEMLLSATSAVTSVSSDDPLNIWFQPDTASFLRALERTICRFLVARSDVLTEHEAVLDTMSSFASSFYLALFSLVRSTAAAFRSSNPTWLKMPKNLDDRIHIDQISLSETFIDVINRLASWVAQSGNQQSQAKIVLADTTKEHPNPFVDLVLTSPPYCTRIDYAASTRLELAVLHRLLAVDPEDLRLSMIGTTRVPKAKIEPDGGWGDTCTAFLGSLKAHPSFASGTYYYKTHLDYFDKVYRSLRMTMRSLKPGGAAFLVVQDSHYKELHNDVPRIITEMIEGIGMSVLSRRDYPSLRCLSRLNAKSLGYGRRPGSTEVVLCFGKD